MKVYLDLVILINFFFDTLIILSVAILLKRSVKISRVLASSLMGMLSIITLFVRLDNIWLLLLKIFLSVIMVLISFGKNHFLNNLFYFYVITIVLGGCSYLIDADNEIVNVILMLIMGPIIIYLYILNERKLKLELSTIYDVILIDKDNTIKLRGIMDTGNNIKCNITNLPVIMVSSSLTFSKNKTFLVPYKTISDTGILYCIKLDNVIINGRSIDCLVGKSKNINKDEVLLNNLMREKI